MTRPKPSYVSDTENTANDRAMSLAMRQLHGVLRGPVFWIVLGAAILLTAMAGPYYTLERFGFPERLVYWGVTVGLSAVLMTFLSILAFRLTEAHSWNWALVAGLAGLAGIVPVVGTIYLAEAVATGFVSDRLSDMSAVGLAAAVAPPLMAVTLLVNALIHLQNRDVGAEAGTGAQVPLTDPVPLTLLQSKLPPHLGHDIICVQAQDHYVEVTTPAGCAMVLMRLGDAVQDLEPLGGLQVHRSWWINPGHIRQVRKGSSGPEVEVSSGQVIPVGRSFRAAFRSAVQGGSGAG